MIEGYTGYAVSDFGRVISLNSAKYLKPKANHKGYMRVHLPDRYVLVHRLVAGAFLPPPTDDQTQINHKNGDKGDNRLVNIEWCTASENLSHAYRKLGRKAAMEGKHWSDEVRKKMSESNKGKSKRAGEKNANARKIICLETGETFGCIRTASEKMGINYTTLVTGLRNGGRVVGKYHFSYAK